MSSGVSAFFVLALFILFIIAATRLQRRDIVFRVPARPESIRSVVAEVSRSALDARLTEQAIFQCRLATDEACTNIIEHAYSEGTDGEIEVVLRVDNGLHIDLIDFGKPYDPSGIPLPRIGDSIDNLAPGGLGLYLMRKVMDEVYYVPGPRGNRLTMIKRK